MVTNKYFNTRNHISEQNLIEDLIIESIQIYGEDIIYLPRDIVNEDLLYGEDVLSKFEDFFQIEMYIKSVDGFQGEGNFFRKFGIDIKDRLTLVVSRAIFEESVENDLNPPRPREGDLVYFPENEALFEIRYVADESVFYQLGEWYIYELQCEQYVWSHENIKTGIDRVDEKTEKSEYSIYLHILGEARTYFEDEVVYTLNDLNERVAEATVILIPDDSRLEIKDIKGEFVAGERLYGEKSGTTRHIDSVDYQDFVNDASASNKSIDNTADTIIDFSESNPFSETFSDDDL